MKGWTSLLHACKAKNTDCAAKLLAHGASVNHHNKTGGCALHLATKYGDETLLTLLISQGAEINQGDDKGTTSLMLACADIKRAHVIKVLVEAGANVNGMDMYRDPAINFAVRAQSRLAVEQLIAHGADINDFWEPNRPNFDRTKSPLTIALQKRNMELIEVLVRSGAHLNCQNYRGWEPLMVAGYDGDIALLNILLNAKPDGIQIANALLAMLGGHGLDATAHRYPQVVRMLMDCESQINFDLVARGGNTALHLACRHASRAGSGQHPTQEELTCQRGFIEVAEILVGNGAESNVVNEEGKTAFEYLHSEQRRLLQEKQQHLFVFK